MNELTPKTKSEPTIAELQNHIKKMREENEVLRDRLVSVEQERRILRERILKVQKIEAIGILSGGIAHDFNNILASLIGFTELALDDTEKGSILEDNLQEAYRACRRAEELVKQILNFSRHTNGEKKPLQIDLIVKEVLKFIRSVIPATISISKQIRSSGMVMADPVTMHQVVMCLCAKAAMAMEENGGNLQVRLNDVMLEDQNHAGLPGGAYVELMVTDTGKGIPKEELKQLFQADPGDTSTDVIDDIGLPMVYGTVKRIGGEILVQSQSGGTVFQIFFPAHQAHHDFSPYPQKSLPKGDERILFVDDEESIVKMGLRTLTNLGYDVTAMDSSIEALTLINQKHDFFDLIITDMTMPKITGERLVQEIRAIHATVPIILLSGYSPLLNPEKIEAMAIQAFLPKPFLKEDLARTVRRVLDAAITGG